MRVTNNMMATTLLKNLNRNLTAMTKYQEQLSSESRINKPSDDPIGVTDVMYYNTSITETETFQDNVGTAIDYMDTTDSALQSAYEIVARVKELLIKASNGTNNDSSLDAIAKEIQTLRDQVGTIANTTFGTKYIFAGTNVTTAPYDTTNDTWTGNSDAMLLEIGYGVTMQVNETATGLFYTAAELKGQAVDLSSISATDVDNKQFSVVLNGTTYTATLDTSSVSGWTNPPSDTQMKELIQNAINNAQDSSGNTLGQGKVRVSGSAGTGYTFYTCEYDKSNPGQATTLSINIDSAANTSITDPVNLNYLLGNSTTTSASGGPGLLQLLDKINTDITAGNTDNMESDLGLLETSLDNLTAVQATVGARVNRLQLQQSRLETTETNLKELRSNVKDVDIAEAMTYLAMAQNVYTAALETGAKITQHTLADFIS